MKFAILVAGVTLAGMTLQAQTVVSFGAAQDTTIFGAKPSYSDGGGAGLFVGTDANRGIHRALIEFNLGSIPSTATITGVQLTLTLGLTAGSGSANSATIGLFDLTRTWGEGSTGGPTQDPSGIPGSGGGFTANAGDATWNSAFSGSVNWTSAGGDHSSSASASLLVQGSTAGTQYTWSSSQMIADVQNWVENSATNYGWELINADETDAMTAYTFYSREWGNFSGGNAAQEPSLQVTYTNTPEPSTLALLGVGALAPLWRRRAR